MHRIRSAPGVVATATLATLATWVVIRVLLGAEVEVPGMGDAPPEPLATSHVLTAAIVASVAGWASLAALGRLTRNPGRPWTGLALLVLCASLGAPLLGAGIAADDRAALVALHLVLAAVLVPGLARARRADDGRTAGRRRTEEVSA